MLEFINALKEFERSLKNFSALYKICTNADAPMLLYNKANENFCGRSFYFVECISTKKIVLDLIQISNQAGVDHTIIKKTSFVPDDLFIERNLDMYKKIIFSGYSKQEELREIKIQNAESIARDFTTYQDVVSQFLSQDEDYTRWCFERVQYVSNEIISELQEVSDFLSSMIEPLCLCWWHCVLESIKQLRKIGTPDGFGKPELIQDWIFSKDGAAREINMIIDDQRKYNTALKDVDISLLNKKIDILLGALGISFQTELLNVYDKLIVLLAIKTKNINTESLSNHFDDLEHFSYMLNDFVSQVRKVYIQPPHEIFVKKLAVFAKAYQTEGINIVLQGYNKAYDGINKKYTLKGATNLQSRFYELIMAFGIFSCNQSESVTLDFEARKAIDIKDNTDVDFMIKYAERKILIEVTHHNESNYVITNTMFNNELQISKTRHLPKQAKLMEVILHKCVKVRNGKVISIKFLETNKDTLNVIMVFLDDDTNITFRKEDYEEVFNGRKDDISCTGLYNLNSIRGCQDSQYVEKIKLFNKTIDAVVLINKSKSSFTELEAIVFENPNLPKKEELMQELEKIINSVKMRYQEFLEVLYRC